MGSHGVPRGPTGSHGVPRGHTGVARAPPSSVAAPSACSPMAAILSSSSGCLLYTSPSPRDAHES
eukprot:6202709-Prymnesium_polylepis.1